MIKQSHPSEVNCSNAVAIAPEKEAEAAKLKAVISQFKCAVDPLVRIHCIVPNTTPAERQAILRSAHVFMSKGPNVAAPALPIQLPLALAYMGDAGAALIEYRFSGAQQVANWIADIQSRAFAAGGPLRRFTVQLTSNNGKDWSENVGIFR